MTALPEVLEKLEPCPFCGRKAKIGEDGDLYVLTVNHAKQCVLHDAESIFTPRTDHHLALLARDWNTRHQPALLRDAGDGVDYKSKLHTMHRRAQKAEAELAHWKLWANVGWGFNFDKVSAAVNALGRLTDSFRAIEKLRRTRRLSYNAAMHAPGGAGND